MRSRVALAALVVLVVAAIAARLGAPVPAVPTVPGTAVWTTARAAGVIAFVALTLAVAFGLTVTTGALDRWVPRGATIDVHRWLSSVALALTAGHALIFLVDPTMHFDAIAVLVPGFSPYRPVAVAAGTLAAFGALVVHLSIGWRARIGVRAWRALHASAFLVYAAALAHGLTAGSDASRPGLRALYVSAAALVLGLTAIRGVRIARAIAR